MRALLVRYNYNKRATEDVKIIVHVISICYKRPLVEIHKQKYGEEYAIDMRLRKYFLVKQYRVSSDKTLETSFIFMRDCRGYIATFKAPGQGSGR